MNQHSLPLFEVFIRSKRGLDHRHVGSLHAEDPAQALDYARDHGIAGKRYGVILRSDG